MPCPPPMHCAAIAYRPWLPAAEISNFRPARRVYRASLSQPPWLHEEAFSLPRGSLPRSFSWQKETLAAGRRFRQMKTTKRLGDMSEREREALRAQLDAKLGMVSAETKGAGAAGRAGDWVSLDACFDLLDP